MSVILEFSMFPTDKGESKSESVAKSIQIIQDSGLPYKMGSMGTTIEGEWDDVLKVVSNCFQEMKKSSGRIYTSIKMDYRRDGENRMEKKIKSVESRLSAKEGS